MTNTPNNIAGEDWAAEAEHEIGSIIVCRSDKEGLEEIRERGIVLKDWPFWESIKAFIHKTRQEAIAGERERITEIGNKMMRSSADSSDTIFLSDGSPVPKRNNTEDSYYNLGILELLKALTPSPDTSKES